MEQHQQNMKNKKHKPGSSSRDNDDDDERGGLRRPFDPKKDLNTRTMSDRKRSSFVQEASQNFTDRFSSGRFNKFL